MPTVTLKVSAGEDDGFRTLPASFSNSGIMQDIGARYTSFPEQMIKTNDSFYRFISVQIPQGVKIDSAVLRLYSPQDETKPTVNLKICAEADDNPLAVTSYTDYEDRAKTGAMALWHDVGAWYTDVWYESPDISGVIQEIVNRAGWMPGNALQIFVMDDGSHDTYEASTHCLRRVNAFEGNSALAVELVVTYSEAPITQYDLTITASIGGTTSPSPSTYTYNEGEVASVTAIPDSGYRFDHWTLDGANVGSANPISVTMNANHSLHAVFAEITEQHTLNLNSYPIAGMQVLVDGSNVGVTPVAVVVSEGTHTIEVPPEVIV